jgi:hypothetical protein
MAGFRQQHQADWAVLVFMLPSQDEIRATPAIFSMIEQVALKTLVRIEQLKRERPEDAAGLDRISAQLLSDTPAMYV